MKPQLTPQQLEKYHNSHLMDSYNQYVDDRFSEQNELYYKDRKKFISNLKVFDRDNNEITGYTRFVEFHSNNEIFTKLLNNMSFLDGPLISVVPGFIVGTITLTSSKKQITRFHDTILLESGFGHLRICPHKNGLEISRVWIEPELHNKGLGTLLMFRLFEWIGNTVDYIPDIFLECTGSVGAGENYQETPLKKQIEFFRKFGFRVNQKESSYTKGYVQMNLDKIKFEVDFPKTMTKFFQNFNKKNSVSE